MRRIDEEGADRRTPVFWVGSSKDDLRTFPKVVRTTFGQALFDAQMGGKHPDAKPLKGFHGAGVVEVVESFDGNAYRAVYTVKFSGAVYVLHAFRKKSKSGIRTPPADIDTIHRRLADAKDHHAQWIREHPPTEADT